MSTSHPGNAERLGHWLGRLGRGYSRRERRVKAWLVARDLPAGVAIALLWIVKLGVLAVLFYAAFWLALLFVFAVIAAWIAEHADPEEDDPKLEWRDGHSGWGLYDKNEWRHDPGGPDDDQ